MAPSTSLSATAVAAATRALATSRDWYDANAGGNGQDVSENLLGSILRIDVDVDVDGNGGGDDRNYAIPDDNPLVGTGGLDEHYAWGFRNPWRMSFGPDGRLFAADVGQNAYEEVDVVERGGNYGWNVREGTHCFEAESCPDETPDGDPLVDPIIEYPHDGGESPASPLPAAICTTATLSLAPGHLRLRRLAGRGRTVRRSGSVRRASGRSRPSPWRTWDRSSPRSDGTRTANSFVCTSEEAGVGGSSGAVYRLRSA